MKSMQSEAPTTGERVLELLPATASELLGKIGVAGSTLHKWIVRLRAAKQVRICGWRRTPGNAAAVYGKGSTRDAPPPTPRTTAQLQAKYRQSLKDAGLWEDVLADQRKRQARMRRQRGQGRQIGPKDPLMAALFKKEM